MQSEKERLMDLAKFPDYYQKYVWNGKHKLYGYAADRHPEYSWIFSLEKRFIWLRDNSREQKTAAKYLIREMIEWGGSQNGVLQKFEDGCGEVNLYEMIQEVIANLNDREKAIVSSLKLPGLGLTYASKLLRFMMPERYGALDSRIRGALLKEKVLPKIYDGNINSMVRGYVQFLCLLEEINSELQEKEIGKPDCALSTSGTWRPSEIEMALFCWAENK